MKETDRGSNVKIALDAQLLFESQKTGIGWNTKMLIDHLTDDKENEYQLNFFDFRNKQRHSEIIEQYRKKGCKIRCCRWMPATLFRILSEKIHVPYSLFFGKDADITQFFNYSVPYGVGTKASVYVYDMTYKAYPETVSQKTLDWLDRNLRTYCDRADQIITISEFSKREILKHLDVNPDKVSVVPCGVDLDIYRSDYSPKEIEFSRERYKIPEQYILYLGTLEPRKNIPMLIDAYALLKQSMPEAPKLVLAGKKGWMYDEIFQKVEDYNLKEDVIFTGYVDEKDVPLLMAGAQMFVFPSLYEGFGMPPLEAMACGTPVITSNTASLSEVVGEAGLLVPYDKAEALNEGMRKLLLDSNERMEYSKKALSRAEKFLWKKSAELLLDSYKEG